MKPTSEILERIEKCSNDHKDGVFTRLYRYLLREDIYYAAYQKLYANKGATTRGGTSPSRRQLNIQYSRHKTRVNSGKRRAARMGAPRR